MNNSHPLPLPPPPAQLFDQSRAVKRRLTFEEKLAADVYNPKESDFDYFKRRLLYHKERGTLPPR